MLPPYELQNKPFKTAIKGYNPTEVDEHIDFMIEKYTELYRAYNELERKYAAGEAELDQFRKNEDAIRRALVNAQNAGNRIIKEADDRSELILQSTKEKCAKLLNDFHTEVENQQDTLQALKNQVTDFKSRMFTLYQEHIEFLEKISPEGEDGGQWKLNADEYTSKVIGQVVLDVETAAKTHPTEGIGVIPKVEIDDSMLDSLMNADQKARESTQEIPTVREGDTLGFDAPMPDDLESTGTFGTGQISLEVTEAETIIFGKPIDEVN